MRDAYSKFEEAGIRLYAVSYDDPEVLREFTEKQGIPYPLLSDIDSEVIDLYGIRNTQVRPGEAVLEGIPFPGTYITDSNGVVISKFFHDSYKKRDSPELYIDAALGRTIIAEEAPQAHGGDESVRVLAAFHGGGGTLRQGIRRHVVVRFEMGPSMHVYREPVPEGMIPVSIQVTGPPGLEVEAPILPPGEPLELASMGVELQTWSGTVDVAVPVYAVGELASETRPLDRETAPVEVKVRYQACSDSACFPPTTETFVLEVPLDVIDIPAISLHQGHGQREGAYNGSPHLRRLLFRKIKASPLGFLRFAGKNLRLELAARMRALRHR